MCSKSRRKTYILTTTATLLNKKLQLNRFQWLLMLQVLLLSTTTSGKSKCILKVVCDRRFSCNFRIASASRKRKIVIIWRNFRLCVKVGQKEADCRFCSSFFHIFVFSLLCRKLWPHIDPKEAKKLVIVSNCVSDGFMEHTMVKWFTFLITLLQRWLTFM